MDNKQTSAADDRTFNLIVDDVPYVVKVAPFTYNGSTRFYISVNEGEKHVFLWDQELTQFRPIDKGSGPFPDTLEKAISEKLRTKYKPSGQEL